MAVIDLFLRITHYASRITSPPPPLDARAAVGQSAFVDQAAATANRKRTLTRAAVVLGLLAAGAVASILFFCDPASVPIYPVCVFHRVTGLDCPGCGSLRALHQLLRGNFAAAFHLNAMLVLSLPFFAWLGFRFLMPRVLPAFRSVDQRMPPAGAPPRLSAEKFAKQSLWFWAYLAVMILFGIFRNLPIWKR